MPRPKSRMQKYALEGSFPLCWAWPEGGVPVWLPGPTEPALGSDVDREVTIPAQGVPEAGSADS